MGLIKGITVTLHERRESGRDAFNAPIYEEVPVEVRNVLVTPTAASDVVTEMELYGKRSEYTLCLPKGDSHVWDNSRVSFTLADGSLYEGRVFGDSQQWIESNIPLSWNKQIKVERYA